MICTTGIQYAVFKKIARDIAEVNNFTYVETPAESIKKKCEKLIIVDNLLERTGFIAYRWEKETKKDIILYVVTEGYPTITPNNGFGNIIKNTPIITPSKYSKEFLEESGFSVDAVIPHGVKIPNKIKGYEEREKKMLYRSYYIKRKFPPYGIQAIRKALDQKIPIDIVVRDDMYPNGIEQRHQNLMKLLTFKIENSFAVNEENIYDQFSKYLFFLNISDGGGFELEVLENMALGTPVITAYFPPISEYYPKNDLVVETTGEWWEQYPYITIKHHVYDPDKMLETIKNAYDMDKSKWEQISNEIRERAKEYDYKKVYKEFKKYV